MSSVVDDAPCPGDLFLDEALPAWERLTLVRNGWRAEATHVWVGAGWARLVPGPVFPVPDHVPQRRSRPSGATAPEPTPGPLPGPAPRSALDHELAEAEPRRLMRAARRP